MPSRLFQKMGDAYLYCDNRWLYVVISNPHSLSRFFCVGIGVRGHGTDDLAHANDLQESHALLKQT